MIIKTDNSILVSPDGETKIICLKHMEEYFRSEGLIVLEDKKKKLISKYFNFKILRKIRILLTLYLKSKILFSRPQHTEFVIFDCQTTKDIEKLLPKKNYTIISTRIHRIDKIYINKKIIFYIIKNFFKRTLKQNYITALIKLINPKVVVTHISHSTDFHIISKILYKEIKFIAIQSGTSNEFSFMSEKMKNSFFVPTLLCFSDVR